MNFHIFSDKLAAVNVDNEDIIRWIEELGENYDPNKEEVCLGSIASGNAIVQAFNMEDGLNFVVSKNYVDITIDHNEIKNESWKDTVSCILSQYEQ